MSKMAMPVFLRCVYETKGSVMLKVNRSRTGVSVNKGFTMLELVIVLGLIGILAAFTLPKMNSMLIAQKAQTVGREMQALIVKVRNGHQDVAPGSQPYTAVTTSEAANMLRETTFVVTGTGAAATVTHPLGTTTPTVSLAPGTLTVAGDSALITLANVNRGACPDLANYLAKSVDTISINGTNVKAVGGTYNATTAQNTCTDGDTNTFVFQFH